MGKSKRSRKASSPVERVKPTEEEQLSLKSPVERVMYRMAKFNFEPIKLGDWLREPFNMRAHEEVFAYEPAQDHTPEEREAVRQKLRTSCDTDNLKTDEDGKRYIEIEGVGKFDLNFQDFLDGKFLQYGTDVQEAHSWGVDCYTRRNIELALEEVEEYADEADREEYIADYLFPAILDMDVEGWDILAALRHIQQKLNKEGCESCKELTATNFLIEVVEKSEERYRNKTPLTASEPVKMEVAAPIEKSTVASNGNVQANGVDIVRTVKKEPMSADNVVNHHNYAPAPPDGTAVKDIAKSPASNGKENLATLVSSVDEEKAIEELKRNYCSRGHFRVHPKGRGIRCIRKEGIPKGTIVSEYFGEVYLPWRWYEKQDAIKRIVPNRSLPDFYNIQLERPRQDKNGFDMLFVEANFKGSLASRVSHACQANCMNVNIAVNGRLTNVIFTIKPIKYGQELCWDYNCTTESEAEFRQAICLCGSRECRGSFLQFAGVNVFSNIVGNYHTFLDRTALIIRACQEELTEEDEKRFKHHCIGNSALCKTNGDLLPAWLRKWAALILTFNEFEREQLPLALLEEWHEKARKLTPASEATIQPEGESKPDTEEQLDNRVAAEPTQDDQIDEPEAVQRKLEEAESKHESLKSSFANCTAELAKCRKEYGNIEEAKRLFDAAARSVSENWQKISELKQQLEKLATTTGDEQGNECPSTAEDKNDDFVIQEELFTEETLRLIGIKTKDLRATAAVEADGVLLSRLSDLVVTLNKASRFMEVVGSETTVVKILTEKEIIEHIWTGAESVGRKMINHALRSVRPKPKLQGKRAQSAAAASACQVPANQDEGAGMLLESLLEQKPTSLKDAQELLISVETILRELSTPHVAAADLLHFYARTDNYFTVPDADFTGHTSTPVLLRACDLDMTADQSEDQVEAMFSRCAACDDTSSRKRKRGEGDPRCKKYQKGYLWGQLASWYKQTIYDPSASLSADRRGSLSLPDPESAYNGSKGFNKREREELLQQLLTHPSNYWPTKWRWSFKNPSKVYGSPMFDDALERSRKISDKVIDPHDTSIAAWPKTMRIIEELRVA